jgi:ABC-type molybdate transport system substrate-binding protein
VAAVSGHEKEAVARYLQFLRGTEARAVFGKYGFMMLSGSEK